MTTSFKMRVRRATVIAASIPGNLQTGAPFFVIHAKQLEPVVRFIGFGLSAQQLRLSALQFRLADHLLL